jgi:hypothetical protein
MNRVQDFNAFGSTRSVPEKEFEFALSFVIRF